jgi:hypothetical protein
MKRIIKPEVINVLLKNDNTKDDKKDPITTIKLKHVSIMYKLFGCKYHLNVPYDIQSSTDMLQYAMYTVDNEGNVIDNITQQPGIPYLVSANDLKCKSLRAVNQETGILHEYEGDKIPYYCVEIIES